MESEEAATAILAFLSTKPPGIYEKKVLSILLTAPGRLRAGDIAEKYDLPRERVYGALTALKNIGAISTLSKDEVVPAGWAEMTKWEKRIWRRENGVNGIVPSTYGLNPKIVEKIRGGATALAEPYQRCLQKAQARIDAINSGAVDVAAYLMQEEAKRQK